MASAPSFATIWIRALLADPRARPMTKVVGVATFGRFAAARECFVSLATAMMLTGCASRGTVHRAIRQLIALGYVVVLEPGAPPNRPARYLLALPAETAPNGASQRSDSETDKGPISRPLDRSDSETDNGPILSRYRSDSETQVLSYSEESSDAAPPRPGETPGSDADPGELPDGARRPGETLIAWQERVVAETVKDEDEPAALTARTTNGADPVDPAAHPNGDKRKAQRRDGVPPSENPYLRVAERFR